MGNDDHISNRARLEVDMVGCVVLKRQVDCDRMVRYGKK